MLSPLAKPLIALLMLAGPASAHGAIVDVAKVDSISIHARYDTGEPMGDAQVSVFAPDNPAQPWLTGQTDAAGHFTFTPNESAGRWAIQVRQAGHGAMSYIETDTTGITTITANTAGLTWTQRLLMVASVLWGCIGTALYFRRPRQTKAA